MKKLMITGMILSLTLSSGSIVSAAPYRNENCISSKVMCTSILLSDALKILPETQSNLQGQNTVCNFTDDNNDKICDNISDSGAFVDEDRDGVRDNTKGTGKFVDEDNDGVCDNTKGTENFVDADNDGVCDNTKGTRNFVDEDNDEVCDNYQGMSGGNSDNNQNSGNHHNSGKHGRR